MLETSVTRYIFVSLLLLPLLASQANAKCPDYPQVSWWGELSHEGVTGYVEQKHSGNWAGYLDKWRRQLTSVRNIHGKGKGIKIPSTGQILKGMQLSNYISKLEQRVDINQCLSQETGDIKKVIKKKTVTKRMVTTPYGKGVEAYKAGNFEQAQDIWLPLADAGNPKAQNALGHLYRKGLGVKADIKKSQAWYTKSANAGDAVGLYSLGDIVWKTATGKEDMSKAIKLLMRSAMRNYAPAQLALAEINQTGAGVKANSSEAYFWATLAVKNNYKKARAMFEKTGENLTRSEKEALSERASQWLIKYKK